MYFGKSLTNEICSVGNATSVKRDEKYSNLSCNELLLL